MARKRQRTPHFIRGLGNGSVRDKGGHLTGNANDDLFPGADNSVRRSPFVRTRAANERLVRMDPPIDNWRDVFITSESGDDGGRGRGGFGTHTIAKGGPWQMPTFTFLSVIVLFSALFLHLVSESSPDKARPSRRSGNVTGSNGTRRKKKTDEWSEDELDLSDGCAYRADNEGPSLHHQHHRHQQQPHSSLSQGAQGQAQAQAQTQTQSQAQAQVQATTTLYYPYQRYRRIIGAGAGSGGGGSGTGAGAGAGTSSGAGTGTGTASHVDIPMSPRHSPAQQKIIGFQSPSYYPNHGEGAVAMPTYSNRKSPSASLKSRPNKAATTATTTLQLTPTRGPYSESESFSPGALSNLNHPGGGGGFTLGGCRPRIASPTPQGSRLDQVYSVQQQHQHQQHQHQHQHQYHHHHHHQQQQQRQQQKQKQQVQQQQQQRNKDSQHHVRQQSGLQVISSVSSFGSMDTSDHHTPSYVIPAEESVSASPQAKTRVSRPAVADSSTLEELTSPSLHSISGHRRQSASHMLLTPGTDDIEETPRIGHGKRRMGVEMLKLNKTPRAVSSAVSGTSTAALTPDIQENSQSQIRFLPSNERQLHETSIHADVKKQQHQIQEQSTSIPFLPEDDHHQKSKPAVIPFIPRLDSSSLHRHDGIAPSSSSKSSEANRPESILVEESRLLEIMESGNVSHWSVRERDSSKEQSGTSNSDSRPRHPTGKMPSTMPEPKHQESSSSSNIKDARPSIKHKRPDLTEDTNAALSLQSIINFADLKLQEVIGGGGFGQVWRATLKGTPVAVKVLTGSAQGKDVSKAILEEFSAEINLLSGMNHPNICLYMGACIDPPNRAIITELAANGSLWDALRLPLSPPFVCSDGISHQSWSLDLYKPGPHGVPPSSAGASLNLQPTVPPRGTWPWVLVKKVACGVARGMAYLHSGTPPILHRDLKSANILLDESYTAKVCDFGLSRLKAQERSMTGNCGTVQWMAPEVLASQNYNETADVFSFGIICWELLTRECPYDGMNAIQCALAVLNDDYRPEVPKWCPQPLRALINVCVKKDTKERPTFEQILLALDALP